MPNWNNIIKARELAKTGLTQTQIAEMVGVSQKTISLYLRATLNPDLEDELKKTFEAAKVESGSEDFELSDEQLTKVAEQVANSEVTDIPLNEDAKVQKSLDLDRLDGYLQKITSAINRVDGLNDKEVNRLVRLIDTALKVHDRRSKYLGLDSPTKIDAGGALIFRVEGFDDV